MEEGSHAYSRHWFEFFHVPIDEERTTREVEFVIACAPVADFSEALDVCCGMGRHARALSQRGYKVTGIDRDPNAISRARELGGGANYVVADMRDYQCPSEPFNVAMVMGQSFGHFDEGTNRDILFRLSTNLRKRGRIILDLWNREFFAAHQGERDLETSRGVVRETKRVQNDRLLVELNYPDGIEENFEWQLFTPPQMEEFAKAAGLELIHSCSGFDIGNLPSPTDPRLQFVLECENQTRFGDRPVQTGHLSHVTRHCLYPCHWIRGQRNMLPRISGSSALIRRCLQAARLNRRRTPLRRFGILC